MFTEFLAPVSPAALTPFTDAEYAAFEAEMDRADAMRGVGELSVYTIVDDRTGKIWEVTAETERQAYSILWDRLKEHNEADGIEALDVVDVKTIYRQNVIDIRHADAVARVDAMAEAGTVIDPIPY